MWRALAVVVCIGLTAAARAAAPAAQTGGPASLVVILVVDQMRADYLTTFASRWQRGFRTLLERGTQFTHAEYPYWSTITCAGHTSIATGTLPRTHGMVSDTWWDRDTGRQIGCTEDEAAPPVTYGRPTTVGASGRRLMVPTLADRLREGGFSVDRVLVEDLRPVPAVCAIGRPQGGTRRPARARSALGSAPRFAR